MSETQDTPDQSVNQQVEDEVLDSVEVVHREAPAMPTARQLTRLIMGLSLIGGEKFLEILQHSEENIETSPGFSTEGSQVQEETEVDQMRYLMIGAMVQAQKRAVRGARKGLKFTLRTTGAMLGAFYALTDNALLRPIRYPVDNVLNNMARDADQALRSGRYEEKQSKAMAQETVNELVDELTEYIANNPKLSGMVSEIVGSQSVGMAHMTMDGITVKTASADDSVEGLIRRILRMTPREELPESPIAGQPQYMYLPEHVIPDDEDVG